jgi:hypothetical protein
VNSEQRLWGRGWYFGQITVDPANPDRAYDINTATYMTLDAGKTWVPVKGAPGGDDYHQLWINPRDGNRMVLSSDQGTVVSVDGAKTWSTWYNQPTAQIYHVAQTIASLLALWRAAGLGRRGRQHLVAHGHARFRNWEPTCQAGESNTVVPDPEGRQPALRQRRPALQPGAQSACARGRRAARCRPQRPQPQHLDAAGGLLTGRRGALLLESVRVSHPRPRQDVAEDQPRSHALHPEVPKTLDPVTAKDIDQPMTDRFGVVYTIGPSPLDAKTVWVGTDDGLIHVTRDDGAHWQEVTPPADDGVEQGLAD